MEQTRRDFIRTATMGMPGIIVAGGIGAASSARAANGEEPSGHDGCFRGIGIGAKADLSALVVIEGGKITSVIPGPNEESEGPGQRALSEISRRVVEEQSINVDALSGATFTSMGYLTAIAEAVEQAGVAEAFDVPATQEPIIYGDTECDVVIVGAGAAGLMAALTLKYPDGTSVVSDTNVLVLEKLDIPGGSTQLCFGGLASGDRLVANEVSGYLSTPDDMVDMLRSRNTFGVNEPLARAVMERAPEILKLITDMGGPYSPNITGTLREYGGHKYLQMDGHANLMLSDFPSTANCFSNQGGYRLAYFLETKVRQSGCEIRTGAGVTELLMEDGAVVGVRVGEGDGAYDVRAKKVILACGGFSQNADLMAEMMGDLLPSYMPWCGAGSTGDAFKMTEGLGVTRVGEGAMAYFSLADARYGMYSDLNNTFRKRQAILVTEEGKRIVDESIDEYEIGYTISRAPGGHLFVIIDSMNPGVEVFERWVGLGKVAKASTLEELAEQMGIDPAGLAETVATYNAAYDAGGDDEFGTAVENMNPVVEGPFYAGELTVCVIGTLVGLQVDEDSRLLGEGGQPIENLYATGEIVLGGNILSRLYAGGVSIATALATGQIAAEHARATL